jgi:parallel beta-helix repeat protein
LFKRAAGAATLILLSISLTGISGPTASSYVTYNSGREWGHYQMDTGAIADMPLSQVMQSFEAAVNWNQAVYAGVLFGDRTNSDLEAMIRGYAAAGDWLNVLKWAVICRKLGIEPEASIRQALDGLDMVGPLPHTSDYEGTPYFGVEQKFALFGYYYAEKYGYRLDKWNKTNAYNLFKGAIYANGRPVLFVGVGGSTWTISYGPRYYDEAASTVQCFLIFYELGINDALDDALHWWGWINDNLWYENTHYKYALNWPDYECEAGFFTKIVAGLKYYSPSLENWPRVLDDMQNRFLNDRWNSPQWCQAVNSSTYAVVHHYPSNFQRRLQNTIGAWISLYSIYDKLSGASQTAMQDMLCGYGGLAPAWKLLMSPVAGLYDNSTGKFAWTSGSSGSDDATGYALSLLFFMGIIPRTAQLAFPLEEFTYEYIYDVDPGLYGINLANHTVRFSVLGGGQLEFIFGGLPVVCNIPSRGVYEAVFSNDWNSVASLSSLGGLPSNRRFPTVQYSVIVVPDDFPTIQDAIDHADQSSIVFVRSGVYSENVVVNKTISLLGEDLNTTIIDGGTTGNAVLVEGADGVMVTGFTVRSASNGLYVQGSGQSVFRNVVSDNLDCGIRMVGSDNSIIANTLSNNNLAVSISGDGNRVVANTVEGNGGGVEINGTGNAVYHNNISGNGNQALVLPSGAGNSWDNGYPSGGNFWGDYNGTDFFRGSFQNETGSDGIGDTPYVVGGNDSDRFPLMRPWFQIPGDINFDGRVGLRDLVTLAKAYGSRLGDQMWTPEGDIDHDNAVGLSDLAILAQHYGHHYP